ncbi:hypothetical protein CPB84DRAFT_1798820, partial [Gymnopilus junonius]
MNIFSLQALLLLGCAVCWVVPRWYLGRKQNLAFMIHTPFLHNPHIPPSLPTSQTSLPASKSQMTRIGFGGSAAFSRQMSHTRISWI